MKLTKLWVTISLFFVITFSTFADLTIEDYKSLLRQSRDALIETTAQLDEANQIIIDKEELLVSLEKQIVGDDSAERIIILENLLKDAKDALIGSNDDLELAKKRIADDQIEIKDLRKNLQTCIDNIPEVNMFSLGGGYSVYPQGLQLIFMFDIPRIPLSIYTSGGIFFDPFGLNFTIGATYNF
jgi:hypothetical protein